MDRNGSEVRKEEETKQHDYGDRERMKGWD